MTLGATIRRLRLDRGLTQRQLGDLVGVKQHTISAYEADSRRPGDVPITRLAEALGVRTVDLIREAMNR